MIEKNKNGIIVVVLLSTFFGLAAGIVGSLTIKSYLGTSATFWGEFDFINGDLDRPSVVISGAKKVVVAQDEKINETISQINSSLVGIYEKKATSTKKDMIDLDSFYKSSDKLGGALIVTSDGWIMTDALNVLEFNEKNKELNIKKYVIIKDDKEIYNIDKAEIDSFTNYIFLHIDAKDLPVLNIVNQNNLSAGETVFGFNSIGDVHLSSISSKHDLEDYLSMSSDFYFDKISLVDDMGDNFNSSFVFDVSGRLVLFINKKGELIPSRVFNVAIESLFEKGIVTRPSLGLVYSDLSYYIGGDLDKENYLSTGALINSSPKSSLLPWVEAGLEVGDIIKHLDGVILDEENNLTKILMNYFPGDEVEFGFLRGEEEMKIIVKLDELK